MACRTCSLSDIKWFYFSWFSIILHAKKPPRPRKLSSIRRGQFDAFRIPAYFFGRKKSKRDKIRQKNEHFLNKQTKNTFYIPYTPHAPLEAAAAAEADRETDTVTDLILLINAMQLLCCCCCRCCRCCSAGLSAASWRRCCCIQSAICNTISAQQRKNEVIGKWLSNGGRPSSSSSVATAWRTYIHIYSACHLVAATYILWSSHTKCLASWDYFLTAALLACLLAKLQHTALAPAPMWHAACVDNQASAYKTQCLHVLWHAKRLSSDVSYAACYVPSDLRDPRGS